MDILDYVLETPENTNPNVLKDIIEQEAIIIEPLTVTQNGVVTAPSGTAYSPVTVEVPGVKVYQISGIGDEEVDLPDGFSTLEDQSLDLTAVLSIEGTEEYEGAGEIEYFSSIAGSYYSDNYNLYFTNDGVSFVFQYNNEKLQFRYGSTPDAQVVIDENLHWIIKIFDSREDNS